MAYCSGSSEPDTKDAVATVNDRSITLNTFLTQTQSIANTPGVNLSTKNGRMGVLKEMINEELVFQQALKEKFHLQNLDVKHEVVREYLKNKFGKDLPAISDDQVKTFYEAHKADIDQIRASHILIIPKNKEDKASKQEAKTLAQKVRAEVVSGQISFIDAVKKYSNDDATVPNGGDLNFFPKQAMVEGFSNAAFALKNIGDISQPAETEFGYHIIQLTGDQRGMDKAKEKIKWKLYQDAIQPKVD